MDNTTRENFLKEFHDLLEKYNVEISIGLDGDTHGLNSWIDIEHRKGSKYETILTLGGEINVHELKQYIQD
jgi:hypothetical protein